jgi:hypothetical protein
VNLVLLDHLIFIIPEGCKAYLKTAYVFKPIQSVNKTMNMSTLMPQKFSGDTIMHVKDLCLFINGP